MGKWEMVRLGEVFYQIKNGASIKQGVVDGGIPITRIETISDGTINREKLGYAGVSDDKYSNFYLEDGDILMSHINSEKHLGKVALYIKKGEEQIIHGMNLLCLKSNGVSQEYMYYFFKSNVFKNQIPPITKKSVNQASFTVTALKNLSIPLPPLDEQKRIAKNLDLASEIVKGYKEQLAELDKLMQSVFCEMFGNPLTNEKEWEIKKLGEIYRVGSSKRIYQSEQAVTGVPFLRISDLVKRINTGLNDVSLYISSEQYETLKNKSFVPEQNDILVTTRGTLGLCYIVKKSDRFYFQDGMISWLHKKNIDVQPTYVATLFSNPIFRRNLDKIQSGTTVPYLSIAQLSEFNIIFPPFMLQTRFASVVTEIEAQKVEVQQALTEAENLFNSLMQEYFE